MKIAIGNFIYLQIAVFALIFSTEVFGNGHVYLSLSPHPKRLQNLEKIFTPLTELIEDQTVNQIIVNIPKQFRNELGGEYDSIEIESLKSRTEENLGKGRVIFNTINPDLGPISKLLPTLDFLRNSNPIFDYDATVITIDDDRIYSPEAIQRLIQSRSHTDSPVTTFAGNHIGFWLDTYEENIRVPYKGQFPGKVKKENSKSLRDSPVDMVEGWAAVAYRLSDISPASASLMSKIVQKNKDCRLSDDLVISFVLGMAHKKKAQTPFKSLKVNLDLAQAVTDLIDKIKTEALEDSQCSLTLKKGKRDGFKVKDDSLPLLLKDDNQMYLVVKGKKNRPVYLSVVAQNQEEAFASLSNSEKFDRSDRQALEASECEFIRNKIQNNIQAEKKDNFELPSLKVDILARLDKLTSTVKRHKIKENGENEFLSGFPPILSFIKKMRDQRGLYFRGDEIEKAFYDRYDNQCLSTECNVSSLMNSLNLKDETIRQQVHQYFLNKTHENKGSRFDISSLEAVLKSDLKETLSLSPEKEDLNEVDNVVAKYLEAYSALRSDGNGLEYGSGYTHEELSKLENKTTKRVEQKKYQTCMEALIPIFYNQGESRFLTIEEASVAIDLH